MPVASESGNDKAQALPHGLKQVFIKVSGNERVRLTDDIKAPINTAVTLLHEFSNSATSHPIQPYILEAHFDSETINQFLRDAALPIWGVNRPLIIGWVEWEGPHHPAEIIDATSDNIIQKALKIYADQR